MDWHTFSLGFFLWLTSSGLLLTLAKKNSDRKVTNKIDINESQNKLVSEPENRSLVDSLRSQLEEKMTALNSANRKISELEKQLNLTQNQLAKNQDQDTQLQKDWQEQNIHLKAQIDSLKKEIKAGKQKVAEKENKQTFSQKGWQEKITDLTSKINNLQEELILKNNKLEQTEQKYQELQKKWQEKSINYKLQIEALQEELSLNSDQLELTQNKYFNSQQNFEQQATKYRDKIEILEYKSKKLTKQLETLPQKLEGNWQIESIAALQELLISYPTAKLMVELRHSVPAKNIIALLKPMEELLQKWGVETIGQPWKRVPYNPDIHDCGDEDVQTGQLVYIRWVGYHQGDRVLLPAKVSLKLPIKSRVS